MNLSLNSIQAALDGIVPSSQMRATGVKCELHGRRHVGKTEIEASGKS